MKHDFEARRQMNDPVAALPHDVGAEIVTALRDSLELELPELFIDVVTWAQSALVFRDVSPSTLARALDAIRAQLGSYVPSSKLEAASKVLTLARDELRIVRLAEKSVIDEGDAHGAIARRLLDALLQGEEPSAARETLLAMAGGMNTLEIYEKILTRVLHETGRLWQRNELSISQEHLITAAVERMMAQMIDLASSRPHRDFSVVCASLGTSGHDVGARMVADAFALCGWHSSFLGCAIPVDDLLAYVDRISVDVLAVSATLARDVLPLRAFIDELMNRPVAPIVLVGGQALSAHPSLWRRIGADGYAASPLMAVALANDLVCHCASK